MFDDFKLIKFRIKNQRHLDAKLFWFQVTATHNLVIERDLGPAQKTLACISYCRRKFTHHVPTLVILATALAQVPGDTVNVLSTNNVTGLTATTTPNTTAWSIFRTLKPSSKKVQTPITFLSPNSSLFAFTFFFVIILLLFVHFFYFANCDFVKYVCIVVDLSLFGKNSCENDSTRHRIDQHRQR